MRPDSAYEDLGLTQRFMNLEWRLEHAAPAIDVSSRSAAMREVMTTLEHLARTDVPLLLRGEMGTGKTTLAWLIHERSDRRDGPFVSVDCPALRQQLSPRRATVERTRMASLREASVLLHARVDDARGGTLFLDEVDALPAELAQRMLARLRIETSCAAGGNERDANIRVVAASRPDTGAPSLDEPPSDVLAAALGARVLRVPALRERLEDIPALALHFLRSLAASMQRPTPRLTGHAARRLVAHAWPGNIRELRNAVEHALLMSQSNVVHVDAFRGRLTSPRQPPRAEPSPSRGPR
jgi:DNA-binding NtrC family response regulator